MSNIEITADNIKKFAKRLQKNTKEKGFDLSLSESQELLARTLGSNNYNALIKNIETSKNSVSKKSEIENPNNLYSIFINQIKEIVNHPDNGINLCFLECNNAEKHDYSLVFESSFGDHYSFNFCKDEKFLSLFTPTNNFYSDNETQTLRDDFHYHIMKFGISFKDALKISDLLISPSYNSLHNRFESIKFTKNLFDFIGSHKKRHMIKFEKSIHKEFEIIDGDYYTYYLDDVSEYYINNVIFRRGATEKLLLKDGTYDSNYINVSNFDFSIDTLARQKDENLVKIKFFYNFEAPQKVLIHNEWKDIGF